MRYMIMVRSDDDTEAGLPPSAELAAAMAALNDEMRAAGVLVAAEGIQPSSKGMRLSFAGGRPTVTDGPFAESKEMIAGFTIIDVASREDALAWAVRMPFSGGEIVEVRPLYDADSLPEAYR